MRTRNLTNSLLTFAVVAMATLALGLPSASAAVVTYDFDVAGDDGATIDGWTDVFPVRAPSFPSGTVWPSVAGGRGTGGFARWPDHTGGGQDSGHPNHIMRSPEFSLTATSSIDFQLGGGQGSANTYTNSSDISPTGNSSGSGQQKFYLRRVSDDTYLLNHRRSNNQNNWQSHTWDSAAITGAIAGDAVNEKYTVEWVDTYSGGWGFGMIDDVVLNDVVLAPVIHEVGGDNTIGTEMLEGTQGNEVTTPGVDGVRFIRVVQNVNNTFQVAELQAFEAGTGTNVAEQSAGGVATARDTGHGGVAPRANDGNTSGQWGDGSVWHSGSNAGTWLQIELAADTDLDSVHFWGRTDCCQDRQDDFNLIIEDAGGTELYNQQHTGIGTSPGRNQLIQLGAIISADLTAELMPHDAGGGYTYVFELDGSTNDQITVDNPDPSIFSTIIDINNADIVVEALGPLDSGVEFQLLDADSLTGQYNSLTLPDGVREVGDFNVTGAVTAGVPEPSTFALAALGLLGLGWYGRRRRKRVA